jgi:hypothetical protein
MASTVRGSQSMPHVSLSVSASLLFSVMAVASWLFDYFNYPRLEQNVKITVDSTQLTEGQSRVGRGAAP